MCSSHGDSYEICYVLTCNTAIRRDPDVSEEHIAYIFRTENRPSRKPAEALFNLRPLRCRPCGPPKRRDISEFYDSVTEKTMVFIHVIHY